MLSCICMLSWKYLSITVMALEVLSASAVEALEIRTWGLYGVAEQKGVCRTVLYNGFRNVMGYRNWPTLKHPMAWALLDLGGTISSLPGAHYPTINSPYGADSWLNTLLLLQSPRMDEQCTIM